tara:strand:+ start:317 stop:427 length:111 start_codon:yes stop_codon:yes gene_type:complete
MLLQNSRKEKMKGDSWRYFFTGSSIISRNTFYVGYV